ncbi:hypothetical protein HL667_33690 [Bradyrhizobium sp. 83012]|uniref:Uncharacterized protein n=1 Tax=Bradyrhizobium aeschynomenes TaxID=2734909 RepID=A0ABX2CQL2_9BRAD|nr:hypothetical protein [Bradyrhizobium aeschynomenes]NPU69985.1 hypothetical protein [Bradyrhizobium aeschynomenes]
MLLSFSVPAMRPYIEAGLRQRRGEYIGAARVKRQTIRARKARAEKLLAHDPMGHSIPYDLQLWWKSRTPERELLGEVRAGVPCGEHWLGVRVYALEILQTFIEPMHGARVPRIRINGPRGWRTGDSTVWWSPGDTPDLAAAFAREAYADGFDSPEAFRDYFVPNMGDRFDAILIKW